MKRGARGARDRAPSKAAVPADDPSGDAVLFDLSSIRLDDIESLEIDSGAQTVRVNIARAFATNGINYTEDLALDSSETHSDLVRVRDAVRQLFVAVQGAIQNRAVKSGEMPCASCTGACCRSWDVLVSPSDGDRLRTHGLGRMLESFKALDMNGNVGRMKKAPWKNPQTKEAEPACVGLGRDGLCTIYEARPTVCREFSAWGCDDKEEWVNVPKKRRLKVLAWGS